MSNPSKSHAQILADRMKLPAREAVMLHWRGCWTQYEQRLQKREMPPGERDPAAAEMEQKQRAGYLAKCVTGCVGDLMSCGVALEQAQRAAAFIDALRPAFESCVNEFKAEEVPDFSQIS